MKEKPESITRQELYDQVWTSPMRTLATKYGLSDVGLRNICIRHEIPLPGAGYWTKHKFGKAPSKIKLPSPSKDSLNKIIFSEKREYETEHVQDLENTPELLSVIEFEKNPKNRITLIKQLNNPHPLVLKTQKVLLKTSSHRFGLDKYGRINRWREKVLPISVSPHGLNRALCIFDQLLKAFDKRNYSYFISENRTSELFVSMIGEKVEFRLMEVVTQSDYVPTLEQKRRKEEADIDWWPRYTYNPTGKFQLIIESYVSGIQKIWTDKKNKKVEDYLNDFIVGLMRGAIVLRKRRLIRDKEDQLRKIELEQYEKLIAIQKEEQGKIKQLLDDAKNYHQANLIREYIAARLNKFKYDDGSAELRNWKKWAESIADNIDPICLKP